MSDQVYANNPKAAAIKARNQERRRGQRTYTVRQGDSWASIAGRVLGDQMQLQNLFAANSDLGLVLHPGDQIRIPRAQANPRVSQGFLEAAQGALGQSAPPQANANVAQPAGVNVLPSQQNAPRPPTGYVPSPVATASLTGANNVPMANIRTMQLNPQGPQRQQQFNAQQSFLSQFNANPVAATFNGVPTSGGQYTGSLAALTGANNTVGLDAFAAGGGGGGGAAQTPGPTQPTFGGTGPFTPYGPPAPTQPNRPAQTTPGPLQPDNTRPPYVVDLNGRIVEGTSIIPELIGRGIPPLTITPYQVQQYGLSTTLLEQLGYFRDAWGNWMRPFGQGSSDDAGGLSRLPSGYYGRGGGYRGGGRGGYSPARYSGGASQYTPRGGTGPTGRNFQPALIGLVSWRI